MLYVVRRLKEDYAFIKGKENIWVNWRMGQKLSYWKNF